MKITYNTRVNPAIDEFMSLLEICLEVKDFVFNGKFFFMKNSYDCFEEAGDGIEKKGIFSELQMANSSFC